MTQNLDLHKSAQQKAEARLHEEIQKRIKAETTIAELLLENKRLSDTAKNAMICTLSDAIQNIMDPWAKGRTEHRDRQRFAHPRADSSGPS